jgi:predicted phage-related endonuclease
MSKANEAQEDAQWMLDRAGKFTASRAADLMAKTNTGPSASRGNLIVMLAVERLTGQCVETYQNGAMARGIEMEGEARDAYSFAKGVAVEEAGYIAVPATNVGCSPDGLVGIEGIVEIKCPASMAKHVDYLRSGAHAVEYRWQLQHQMMVTGRQWNDVCSYDPRFPEGLQLAITRVQRDDDAIEELINEINKADAEVNALVAELRGLAQ